MSINPKNISRVQKDILRYIKSRGETTTSEIADRLKVTYEAVRQHLRQLELAGLLNSQRRGDPDGRAGRPTQYFSLSPGGDHLFPKAYDELVVQLIDILPAALGEEALEKVLTRLTDENVKRWKTSLEKKSLQEKLSLLKDFYQEEDPHMTAEVDKKSGELQLVEKNCPFLNVALRRPALCSVTISTLTRLLGYRVTREKRFQDGDGRCVFKIHLNQPVNLMKFRFRFEDAVK